MQDVYFALAQSMRAVARPALAGGIQIIDQIALDRAEHLCTGQAGIAHNQLGGSQTGIGDGAVLHEDGVAID